MSSRPTLAALIALAAFACDPAPAPADDAAPLRPLDDGAAYDVAVDAPFTLREELGRAGSCAAPATCLEGYRAFHEKAAPHARPVTEADLVARLEAIDAGAVAKHDGALSADALRDVVLDGLRSRFLWREVKASPLAVTIVDRVEHDDHVEHRLLFDDPWVGEFGAIWLVPRASGPSPALLALHGHGDTAEVFRDDYHGRTYASRGFSVLMPTSRAMGSNVEALSEAQIARELLLDDLNLMGLRVHEALLGLRFLRGAPGVDPSRVGLVGHSGGGSTANLVARLDRRIAAHVADHSVDWAEWKPALRLFHCETVPDLFPYATLLDDLSTSPVPALRVPYGYEEKMPEVFAFLDQHVAGR